MMVAQPAKAGLECTIQAGVSAVVRLPARSYAVASGVEGPTPDAAGGTRTAHPFMAAGLRCGGRATIATGQ